MTLFNFNVFEVENWPSYTIKIRFYNTTRLDSCDSVPSTLILIRGIGRQQFQDFSILNTSERFRKRGLEPYRGKLDECRPAGPTSAVFFVMISEYMLLIPTLPSPVLPSITILSDPVR
jgi:hypothetical protein